MAKQKEKKMIAQLLDHSHQISAQLHAKLYLVPGVRHQGLAED